MVAMRYFSLLVTVLTACYSWAQKPYVEIRVEPSNVEVGEQFNVIVKSNVSGEINIQFPKAFEQGYNVMNRMEQEFDGNSGEMTTFFFHGRSGSLNQEGKFTFGPAFITKGKKVYKSNKVTVTAVGETSHPSPDLNVIQMRKPAIGIIEVSKNKVYAGEALVVNSRIISQFKPTHYESYKSFTFSPTVDAHELGADQQPMVELIQVGRQNRFAFDNDKTVIFANVTGKIKIEPFVMTLQSGFEGYEVRSHKNTFTVIPLPKGAPRDFTGGVGVFQISSALDEKVVKQGEMVTFTVTIKGYGNLHDISKPKIDFGKDFKLYGDPKLEDDYAFTTKGADGEIRIIYHLQVIGAGNLSLPEVSMSYFDPNEEKYKSTQADNLELEVEKNPDFVVQDQSSADKGEMQMDRYNTAETSTESFLSSPTAKWVGISTPLVLALLFLFFRKKKEEDPKPKNTKISENKEPEITPVSSQEFLSVLQALANNGNGLPFFTQLSRDLQIAVSQTAHNDPNWILSLEERKQFFQAKGFSDEFQKNYFELQQTCELCRYGCQVPDSDLNTYVDKAKSIFETLEAKN